MWGAIGLFPTIYTSIFAKGTLYSVTLYLYSLSVLRRFNEERYQYFILHLPTILYSFERVIFVFPLLRVQSLD